MCVRTKTSYDCGCVFKTTNECDISGCSDLDRYHYMKDGDCQNCKSAGADGTRGREGKGRYAKQIKRTRIKDRSHQLPETEQESLGSSTDSVPPTAATDTASMSHSVGGRTSPWVPARGREKPWESPHRKQADEAWLSEHETRLSDLQERFETCSLAQRSEPKTPSHRHVYEPEEYIEREQDQQNNGEDYDVPPNPFQIEISKRLEDGSSRQIRSDRAHGQQGRQHSDESLPDSMPSYRSSPLSKNHSSFQYTYPDRPRDYDFYTSTYAVPKPPTRRQIAGAKTEPYVYNRSPYSYDDYAPPTNNLYSPQHHKNSSHRYRTVEPTSPQYVRYRPEY